MFNPLILGSPEYFTVEAPLASMFNVPVTNILAELAPLALIVQSVISKTGAVKWLAPEISILLLEAEPFISQPLAPETVN